MALVETELAVGTDQLRDKEKGTTGGTGAETQSKREREEAENDRAVHHVADSPPRRGRCSGAMRRWRAVS